MVHGEQLAEDLAFDLFDKVIDGISIYEASLFSVVGV
jgi:hypothetical protein